MINSNGSIQRAIQARRAAGTVCFPPLHRRRSNCNYGKSLGQKCQEAASATSEEKHKTLILVRPCQEVKGERRLSLTLRHQELRAESHSVRRHFQSGSARAPSLITRPSVKASLLGAKKKVKVLFVCLCVCFPVEERTSLVPSANSGGGGGGL